MSDRRRRSSSKSSKHPAETDTALSKNVKIAFSLIVVAILILVGTLSYVYLGDSQNPYSGQTDDGTSDYTPPPTVEFAPDFSYQTVNGGYVSLSNLRGDVVILDFMAMWCQPCGTQMSILAQVQEEYSARGVTIVSIDVDTSETASDLLAYKIEKGATWDFVIDTGGISSNSQYDASSIPTMILIKRDGSIADRYVGVTSFDVLKAGIDPLL